MVTVQPLVPAPRVMRRLLRPAPGPVTGALGEEEGAVLRAPLLDGLLLTEVAGLRVPRDLLTTPAARARAVAGLVPPGAVLMGPAALWVHDGEHPPAVLDAASTSRAGASGTVRLSRATVEGVDVVLVGGLRCATPSRAAVDLARTAPPARAVGAVLRAVRLGATRSSLLACLSRCRGAGVRGRPRARRVIEAVTAAEA